ALRDDLERYRFHPALLDACFHVLMGALILDGSGPSDDGTYIPVQIGRIRVHRPAGGDALWSHARVRSHSADGLSGDLSIFDHDGALVAEITSFRCQLVPGSRREDDWRRHLYE